jgi:hypothetical protein
MGHGGESLFVFHPHLSSSDLPATGMWTLWMTTGRTTGVCNWRTQDRSVSFFFLPQHTNGFLKVDDIFA